MLRQPASHERLCGRLEAAAAGLPAQLLDVARLVVEQVVETPLPLGERRGRRVRTAHQRHARALPGAGRQHQSVALPRRCEVVLGDPRPQRQPLPGDARRAVHRRLQQARRPGVAGHVHRPLDNHALQPPPPPWHVHQLPSGDLAALRQVIGEGHEVGPPGVDGDLHKAGTWSARLGHSPMIRSGDGYHGSAAREHRWTAVTVSAASIASGGGVWRAALHATSSARSARRSASPRSWSASPPTASRAPRCSISASAPAGCTSSSCAAAPPASSAWRRRRRSPTLLANSPGSSTSPNGSTIASATTRSCTTRRATRTSWCSTAACAATRTGARS